MSKHRGSQCCAFGCAKRSKPKEQQRSSSEGSSDEETVIKKQFPRTFHSLPFREEKKELWLTQINRPSWSPSRSARICSDHFKECDIDRTGQTVRIRSGAVPTRFKKNYKKKVHEEIHRLPTVRLANSSKSESAQTNSRESPVGVAHKNMSESESTIAVVPNGEISIAKPPSGVIGDTTSSGMSKDAMPASSQRVNTFESAAATVTGNKFKSSQRTRDPESPGVESDGSSDSESEVREVSTSRDLCLHSLIHDHAFYHARPKKLLHQIDEKDRKIISLRKRLKSTQQSCRRLRKRVANLKEIVKQLKSLKSDLPLCKTDIQCTAEASVPHLDQMTINIMDLDLDNVILLDDGLVFQNQDVSKI